MGVFLLRLLLIGDYKIETRNNYKSGDFSTIRDIRQKEKMNWLWDT